MNSDAHHRNLLVFVSRAMRIINYLCWIHIFISLELCMLDKMAFFRLRIHFVMPFLIGFALKQSSYEAGQ